MKDKRKDRYKVAPIAPQYDRFREDSSTVMVSGSLNTLDYKFNDTWGINDRGYRVNLKSNKVNEWSYIHEQE